MVNNEPTAEELYRSAPVAHDAPDGPPEAMETLKNPGSAGTDSKVGAAGKTVPIEVVTDAPVRRCFRFEIGRTDPF